MQGKYADAESYVDKGLVIDPNNYIGWGAKGLIAKAKGHKAEAIFDFNKTLKLNPDDTVALKALYQLEHP
jgi:tetratricopeptide (TPR) repeat protein